MTGPQGADRGSKGTRQSSNGLGSETLINFSRALHEQLPPQMAVLQTSGLGQEGPHRCPENAFYCHSHFTDGETEAQRGKLTSPNHTVN